MEEYADDYTEDVVCAALARLAGPVLDDELVEAKIELRNSLERIRDEIRGSGSSAYSRVCEMFPDSGAVTPLRNSLHNAYNGNVRMIGFDMSDLEFCLEDIATNK